MRFDAIVLGAGAAGLMAAATAGEGVVTEHSMPSVLSLASRFAGSEGEAELRSHLAVELAALAVATSPQAASRAVVTPPSVRSVVSSAHASRGCEPSTPPPPSSADADSGAGVGWTRARASLGPGSGDGDARSQLIEALKGNPRSSLKRVASSAAAEIAQRDAVIAKMEMAEADLKEKRECVICLDKPRDHILIPCGHISTCKDCAEQMVGGDRSLPLPSRGQAACPLCMSQGSFYKVFN